MNHAALELKWDPINSWWPGYKFPGDYHSHNLLPGGRQGYREIERDGLMNFSDGYIAAITEDADYWQDMAYRIGLVTTVVTLGRRTALDPRQEGSLNQVHPWELPYLHKGISRKVRQPEGRSRGHCG